MSPGTERKNTMNNKLLLAQSCVAVGMILANSASTAVLQRNFPIPSPGGFADTESSACSCMGSTRDPLVKASVKAIGDCGSASGR